MPTRARRDAAARKALAAEVKVARLAAGLTQAEAASRARMPQPQWADLEAGRFSPTLRTLARIARALGIEPGDLL